MERVEWSGGGVGEIALPAGSKPAGAVIVVHEWWGLNDDIRAIADRLAAEGFIALAIDVYGGKVTTDPAQALEYANEMKTVEALETIRGALAFLKAHPRSNGRVAITGFCLGGAVTLAAAFQVDGLAAALPFYGNPRPDLVDYARPTPPIEGHFAAEDPFVDVKRTKEIAAGVVKAGGSFDLHVYDAKHAFMRAGDAHAYDADAAKIAWERSLRFLRAHLTAF